MCVAGGVKNRHELNKIALMWKSNLHNFSFNQLIMAFIARYSAFQRHIHLHGVFELFMWWNKWDKSYYTYFSQSKQNA